MKITLKYGSEGIPVDIEETPGLVGIIIPSEPAPVHDPATRIKESLQTPVGSRPLAEIARGRKSACIIISDATRPVPNTLMLPLILEAIEAQGVPRSRITILVATGMHRPSGNEERAALVGPDILERYRVSDHLSRIRDDMIQVGMISGLVPALVNRIYVEADLKILTGFIEPHMWAGYSGGRKSILPGISSVETFQFMHGPEMIAHPGCEYGQLEGNPFHEAGLEIMEKAGADFVVNVTLDTEKRITGIFAGHPVKAHLRGCAFLAYNCVRELEAPLDFIITSNAGAPLDCNLYQTVKGITGAATVVKHKGDIVIASRCAEGAGSPEYRHILEMVDSPDSFVCRIMQKEFFIPDQWCAQETYQVLMDRDVWLYTDGLSSEDVTRYHFRPVTSIEATIAALLEKHGPHARWAVVPDGPMVILKLRQGSRSDPQKETNT